MPSKPVLRQRKTRESGQTAGPASRETSDTVHNRPNASKKRSLPYKKNANAISMERRSQQLRKERDNTIEAHARKKTRTNDASRVLSPAILRNTNSERVAVGRVQSRYTPTDEEGRESSGREGASRGEGGVTLSERRSSDRQQELMSSIPLRTDDVNERYNRLKSSLNEAVRDKRAITSAYMVLKAKCDEQQQEIGRQSQHILALEVSANKTKRDGRRKARGRWSADVSEHESLGPFEGIALALRANLPRQATFTVTESFFHKEHGQIRDWRGSATVVDPSVANRSKLFVHIPDGSTAIPICSMMLAQEGEFYTSPHKTLSRFLKESTSDLLEGTVGKHFSEEMKSTCISRISAHKETLRRFRVGLSDSVSARKKAAKITYVKNLGYKLVATSEARDEEEDIKLARSQEKKVLLEKCSKVFEDGEVDTTHWRSASWEELCLKQNRASTLDKAMLLAETEVTSGGKVDNLFFNEPARRAFSEIRGYEVCQSSPGSRDVSILTLARCDAWMTTAINLVCVGGRGGQRNHEFTQKYKTYLPKAMERIIQEIWNDLERKASEELSVFIGNSQDDQTDKYGNNLREWTVVVESPSNDQVFLMVTVEYFREKVCTWFGDIKDCHIGIMKHGKTKFEMITSKTAFDDFEESDIEEITKETNSTQNKASIHEAEGRRNSSQRNLNNSSPNANIRTVRDAIDDRVTSNPQVLQLEQGLPEENEGGGSSIQEYDNVDFELDVLDES